LLPIALALDRGDLFHRLPVATAAIDVVNAGAVFVALADEFRKWGARASAWEAGTAYLSSFTTLS
jgi:hypothetical protein